MSLATLVRSTIHKILVKCGLKRTSVNYKSKIPGVPHEQPARLSPIDSITIESVVSIKEEPKSCLEETRSNSGQPSCAFEVPATIAPRPPSSFPQTLDATNSPFFASTQPPCRQLFKQDLNVQLLDSCSTDKFHRQNYKPSASSSLAAASNIQSMSSSILAENQMKKSQMDDISCAKKKLETGNIGCHILTPQSQGSNIAMPVGHAGHMMSFPAVGHRHLFPLMTNRTGNRPIAMKSPKPLTMINQNGAPENFFWSSTHFERHSEDKENIPPPHHVAIRGVEGVAMDANRNPGADRPSSTESVTSKQNVALDNDAADDVTSKFDVTGGEKRKKTRTTFNKEQKRVLAWNFTHKRYLGLVDRANLATELNLTEKQIKIWFQNQRSKLRKEYMGRELIVPSHPMGAASTDPHAEPLQMQQVYCEEQQTPQVNPFCSTSSSSSSGGAWEKERKHQQDSEIEGAYPNNKLQRVEHDCRDNTQQQMLDDLAAEEDRKQQQQTIHAAMLLSQQQQQPRQPSCYQHVEKALADSTLDNQLVIDCPPSV